MGTAIDSSPYSINVGCLRGSIVCVAGHELDISRYNYLFERVHPAICDFFSKLEATDNSKFL